MNRKNKDKIDTESFKEVQLGPKKIQIPQRWEITPLKRVAKDGRKTFVDGDWVESDDMVENGEYQLIQLGNLGAGCFRGVCDKFVSEDFFQENNCTLVEKGDLLISRMTDPILRTIIVPEFNKKSITAVDVVIAKVDEKEWDKRYIKLMLNHKIWTDVGEAYASGSTRLRISRKNLEQIKIPRPPLPEQKKIAEILSTVDEAIQKTEEIIEQTKELKKGLMQDLLTKGIGHEEFKEVQLGPKSLTIPRQWEAKQLKQISKKGRKTFVDGDWVESGDMVEDGKYQLIQLGNIGEGHFKGTCDKYVDEDFFRENDCTLVEKGDLLISRMTDPILRTIIVPEFQKESITAVDIVIVKVDERNWDKRFIKFLLNHKVWTDVGKAYASGSTRLRISRKNLERITIPKPPLPEQKKITEILSTVDEKIQLEQKHKEKLEELKKGLMQDLLTGKVRVLPLLDEEEKEAIEKADVTG